MKGVRTVLPVIVFAQLVCTSLWFAGNAVLSEIKEVFGLGEGAVGYITSSVQLGFISGTLLFAALTIADRISPSRVFFFSAIAGALSNACIYWLADGLAGILLFRYLTGFFLAGIYPVGMKIAADYHRKGLGRALGYLLGALVLGTALPHLLSAVSVDLPWQYVLFGTSSLAVLGGLSILLFVPDGPYRKRSFGFDPGAIRRIFRIPTFRKAAFGYFGHMWELYAVWAFIPVLLARYMESAAVDWNISLWSFFIIGIGGLSCVAGGYLSLKHGSQRVAFTALAASFCCCLLSPLAFSLPAVFFLIFLLFWGAAVIPDSPQFSTMVAQNAPDDVTGSALTIVNSIGFAITIVSIQLMSWLYFEFDSVWVLPVLGVGPLLGLIQLKDR